MEVHPLDASFADAAVRIDHLSDVPQVSSTQPADAASVSTRGPEASPARSSSTSRRNPRSNNVKFLLPLSTGFWHSRLSSLLSSELAARALPPLSGLQLDECAKAFRDLWAAGHDIAPPALDAQDPAVRAALTAAVPGQSDACVSALAELLPRAMSVIEEQVRALPPKVRAEHMEPLQAALYGPAPPPGPREGHGPAHSWRHGGPPQSARGRGRGGWRGGHEQPHGPSEHWRGGGGWRQNERPHTGDMDRGFRGPPSHHQGWSDPLPPRDHPAERFNEARWDGPYHRPPLHEDRHYPPPRDHHFSSRDFHAPPQHADAAYPPPLPTQSEPAGGPDANQLLAALAAVLAATQQPQGQGSQASWQQQTPAVSGQWQQQSHGQPLSQRQGEDDLWGSEPTRDNAHLRRAHRFAPY